MRFVNMKDHQVFQGKDRKHGYSYQAAVFPNGLACCWGPWTGNERGACVVVWLYARVCARVCSTTDTTHALCEYVAVETDSKKLYKGHLLDDLEEISIVLGQDFVAFGDSAYPIHRFFQHVLKCPKGGSLKI